MNQHVNLLNIITEGRKLPKGMAWGIRSVHPDLASSHGFVWPAKGWARCGADFTAGSECPSHPGDGLCTALTWAGMASGGIPAITLLLTQHHTCEVLGATVDKVRCARIKVIEVVDGARLVRERAAGANLGDADLKGAELRGANLTRAYLKDANLRGANLTRANLTDANLRGADLRGSCLWCANLRYADLTDANLTGADLEGADLRHAYLKGAELRGANLAGADLTDTNLAGANLWGANLAGADLAGANLWGANLWGADFAGANLTGAVGYSP